MLKIWTIQEPSRQWVDGRYLAEPMMVEDDVISLSHRYETVQNAYKRYNLISKTQFYQDWSVREAGWAMPTTTVCLETRRFLPHIPNPSSRSYLPMQAEELSQLLNENGDHRPWVGLVGPSGSG